MNTFFLDKVTRLRSIIPRSNTDPLSKLRDYMEGRDSTMQFRPVKAEEVLEIIKRQKNSKSTGVDFIDTALLSILSKILEKVVFLQFVEYLDQHKLLSPNHHESRYSHNAATALIQM